jgi:hypothetical protein
MAATDGFEFNTSNLENRLVENNLEKDKSLAVRNVIQQSIYDERIANNGLKTTVFLHVVIIVFLQVLIWGKISILDLDKLERKFFLFNLIDFEYRKIDTQQKFDYSCVDAKDEACNFTCKDKDNFLTLLNKDECNEFGTLKLLGAFVIIYLYSLLCLL